MLITNELGTVAPMDKLTRKAATGIAGQSFWLDNKTASDTPEGIQISVANPLTELIKSPSRAVRK